MKFTNLFFLASTCVAAAASSLTNNKAATENDVPNDVAAELATVDESQWPVTEAPSDRYATLPGYLTEWWLVTIRAPADVPADADQPHTEVAAPTADLTATPPAQEGHDWLLSIPGLNTWLWLVTVRSQADAPPSENYLVLSKSPDAEELPQEILDHPELVKALQSGDNEIIPPLVHGSNWEDLPGYGTWWWVVPIEGGAALPMNI